MVAWGPIIYAAATAYSALSKSKKPKKRSTMDKNQKKLWGEYNQGIHGEGPLADLYKFDADKARKTFNDSYARPAYQNFQENVAPTITGSFRKRGLGNSTYASQALGRAGRDVQTDINANMNKYLYDQEQSVQNRRSNAVNNAFNVNTFDYEKPQAGAADSFLQGAGNSAGKYAFNQLDSWLNSPAKELIPGA